MLSLLPVATCVPTVSELAPIEVSSFKQQGRPNMLPTRRYSTQTQRSTSPEHEIFLSPGENCKRPLFLQGLQSQACFYTANASSERVEKFGGRSEWSRLADWAGVSGNAAELLRLAGDRLYSDALCAGQREWLLDVTFPTRQAEGGEAKPHLC